MVSSFVTCYISCYITIDKWVCRQHINMTSCNNNNSNNNNYKTCTLQYLLVCDAFGFRRHARFLAPVALFYQWVNEFVGIITIPVHYNTCCEFVVLEHIEQASCCISCYITISRAIDKWVSRQHINMTSCNNNSNNNNNCNTCTLQYLLWVLLLTHVDFIALVTHKLAYTHRE